MKLTTIVVLSFVILVMLAASGLAAAQTPGPGATLTPTVTITPSPTPGLLPGPVTQTIDWISSLVKVYGVPLTILAIVLAAVAWAAINVGKALSSGAFRPFEDWAGKKMQQVFDQPAQNKRLKEYLTNSVSSKYGLLDLKALDERGYDMDVHLGEVYIPLRARGMASDEARGRKDAHMTTLVERGEGQAPELTEWLARSPRLVVVGRAGSGKSTFLKYAAVVLADALAQSKPKLAQEKKINLSPLPVPVYFPLRDFSVFYDQTLKPEDKTVELQAQALLKFLAHNFSHCNLDADFFRELLRRGRCVIFLDGLDEVKEDLRPAVVEVVEAFVHEFASDDQAHPNRYVVASRPEAYGGQTAFRQFQEVTVEPLDEGQVSDFVHRWYREVFRQSDSVLTPDGEREAAQKQDSLLQAIRDKPQVQALTDNPLLLTLVAMLHHRAQLPDSRVELYRDCIRLLLGMWDKSKAGEHLRQAYRDLTPPEVLSMDLDKRSYYLQPAAFWLLQAGLPYASKPDWVREIVQRRKLQGETGWLEIFLEWAKGRGNLLEEVGDRQYRFRYHRTFQEYLAAGYLVSLEDEGVQIALSLIPNRDWWETLRLMVAATVNPNRQSDLMRRALALPAPEGALLVASCLTEVSGVGLDPALTPTLQQRLVSIMTDVSLAAKDTRAEAGHLLGHSHIGDPRDQVGERVPVVVPVSAGEYWLGSHDDNNLAYENERPRYLAKLPAFWIGKYPVTNAQYRCFIDGKGYETERFWTPEGWAWRQGKYTPDVSVYDEQYSETIKRWVEGRKERDQPYYWKNVMWNISNHPVVGVTWFEAMAYCAWLTEQLRQSDYRLLTGERAAARLPTEAEWEAAARGPAGYEWPWGDTFDPQLANTSESEIERTTAVGQYPLSASPCGALDMAGNVWEWCQGLYKSYPYQPDDGRESISASEPRVLRGGSWGNGQRFARCACRYRLNSGDYSGDVGFRLVLSPQL